MLTAGDHAPPFRLADIDTGDAVTDPWAEGDVVLAFFKVSCPVCKMVTPMVQALADAGVRVLAVGEDVPADLAAYRESQGQRVPTVTEPAPYRVSAAYGLEAVPAVFLVGADGVIRDAVPGWSRDGWNRLAAAAGAPTPLSTEDDGLRPFRPG